jgi:hypothetical protein
LISSFVSQQISHAFLAFDFWTKLRLIENYRYGGQIRLAHIFATSLLSTSTTSLDNKVGLDFGVMVSHWGKQQ